MKINKSKQKVLNLNISSSDDETAIASIKSDDKIFKKLRSNYTISQKIVWPVQKATSALLKKQ